MTWTFFLWWKHNFNTENQGNASAPIKWSEVWVPQPRCILDQHTGQHIHSKPAKMTRLSCIHTPDMNETSAVIVRMKFLKFQRMAGLLCKRPVLVYRRKVLHALVFYSYETWYPIYSFCSPLLSEVSSPSAAFGAALTGSSQRPRMTNWIIIVCRLRTTFQSFRSAPLFA